ncbi:unnamed protein product [Haemonchus placei]|uniref:Uncharacterized protein n=1 Tax=Haemonchus placei TaxID=6290 RepID=A0A3P7UD86_HAEPC|nr:unnamed protein product [Haemonchus placei]
MKGGGGIVAGDPLHAGMVTDPQGSLHRILLSSS